MTFHAYSQLLKSLFCSEERSPYDTLSERHIQALWLEQKYFRQPQTREGDSLQILSPGRWNTEAGPDFLDAHIMINGLSLKGDIEIHLTEDQWQQHKHHHDPHYNRVILHVAFWDHPHVPIFNEVGSPIPRVALEPWLTLSPSRLTRLIDLELYPSVHSTQRGRCQEELFSHLSQEQVENLLYKAALWRLESKAHFLNEQSSCPEDKALVGTALCLGYKHNSRPFLEVLHRLRSLSHLEQEERIALALGWGGFFSAQYQEKWSHSPYYCALRTRWNSLASPAPTLEITTHKVRPFNHPVRRLAYLAVWLMHPSSRQVESWLLDCWKRFYSSPPTQLLHALLQALPSLEHPHWNSHFTFQKQSQPISWIGTPLKQLFLTNSLLPLLYSHLLEKGSGQELEAFDNFYKGLKSLESRKGKYLHERFFKETSHPSFLKRSFGEQGSFQIHKDFCAHHETSCQGCPFPQKVHALFNP